MNLILALVIVGGQAASAPTSLVLDGLDPVLLVEGKQVIGQPHLTAAYLRHEYRFSTEENLARFKADPVRFAVQNGGACAKMGELTGRGSPSRWVVTRGKIFLFASDGCKSSFLQNEERYFEAVEVAPPATPEDRKRAQKVFDTMIQAHGGSSALRSAKHFQWQYDTPYKQDGKDLVWHTVYALMGPNKYAYWEVGERDKAFFSVDGSAAFEGKRGEVYGVHPGEQRQLKALFARSPAGILMGASSPVATLEGGARGLVMARDDVVFRVYLDPKTFRIDRVAFKDRFFGPVNDIEIEYSDYANVAGIALPKRERTRKKGGEWGHPKEVASWSINGPVPDVFGIAIRQGI